MTSILLMLAACTAQSAASPERIRVPAEHVKVFSEPGRFGGWPANNGIWSWGDEILVGFRDAAFKAQAKGHAVDDSRPERTLLARSLDGGRTWALEKTPFDAPTEPAECDGGLDFTHPDFAMALRTDNPQMKAVGSRRAASVFFFSTDRGRSWKGPFALPLFGQTGIDARTDYLVGGAHDMTVFLSARKSNGQEGRVLCARTQDGAKTWHYVSAVGPQEPGRYSIMPSSVRLSERRILTTLRRNEGPCWIDAYVSADGGETWDFLSRPAPDTGWGNPSALVRLKLGGVCVAYGYRTPGYRVRGSQIRARISKDDGATWGPELILRDGGGDWDIGYPRMVQRSDGKLVTIYYFNEDAASERFIEATVWDPQSAMNR